MFHVIRRDICGETGNLTKRMIRWLLFLPLIQGFLPKPPEKSGVNISILLGQWLNFKLFGITYYLVGKIKFKLFFSGSIGWVSNNRVFFSQATGNYIMFSLSNPSTESLALWTSKNETRIITDVTQDRSMLSMWTGPTVFHEQWRYAALATLKLSMKDGAVCKKHWHVGIYFSKNMSNGRGQQIPVCFGMFL